MLSSQVDRVEPLYIYGPAKLADYIEANRKILDMYINYPIYVIPVQPGVILEEEEYYVNCFPLKHTKQCFGYSLVEKERPGEFSVENALSHKVPRGPLWGKLQKGEDVINLDGEVVHPSDVLGEKRKGRKFSYVTDTMYFPEISDYVRASDILLCEAMFTEDLKEDALSKKHMTAMQAATIAKDGEVDMLCLQHYSPRYSDKDLKLLLEEAKTIFENTILTRDRMIFEVANHESP